MSAIRSVDMKPEMIVRSLVHRLGYRFRLHGRDLPGKSDLVFRSRRKVIFVHGCFWHQHHRPSCKDGRPPKSNAEYWSPKLIRNVERDALNVQNLRAAGWKVLVLWECDALKTGNALANRIVKFLD
jgi:DNA mismatch endonuclease (patch repair protein)